MSDVAERLRQWADDHQEHGDRVAEVTVKDLHDLLRERDEARAEAKKFWTLWREAENAGRESDEELRRIRAERDEARKEREALRELGFKMVGEKSRLHAQRDKLKDALRLIADKQLNAPGVAAWDDIAFWMADTALEALAELEEA